MMDNSALGRRALSNQKKDQLFGVCITAPAIILLVLLFIYPIIYSLIISFTNYNYVRGTMKFVGLRNYMKAFEDADFINSLKVTFSISIASVIVQFVFGIMLAAFVVNTSKGQNFFKSVFLIPMMVAPTVAGLLWRFMLNTEFGVINSMLRSMNMVAVPWLIDKRMVIGCVVLADSWSCIPFVFLLMYTALTGIPQDMIEAGKIDGGNAWQMFFSIQLPCVRAAFVVTLVLRFMDVFRIFDSIYIMTQGGPGTATEALSLYIYRVNWNKYQMGKASSLSYIMMIIMTVIGLTMQHFSEDRYDRNMHRAMRKAARREKK